MYENEKLQWRRGPFGAGSRQGERGGRPSFIMKRAMRRVAVAHRCGDCRRTCPTPRSLESVAELSVPAAGACACHSCQRTAGRPMRDHKRPRKFGGPSVAENIVRCCQMCNVIKSSRPDELFVVFFSFPSNTGAEYRAVIPMAAHR
jgi:hypothetical protein